MSKLRINNTELTQTSDICNTLNKYCNTVGQELLDNLVNTNNNLAQSTRTDFTKYCGKPIKNSMYCEPVNLLL